MKIRDINIVYGVGKEVYVEVSYNDGVLINVLQEQIGLNELTAYIERFTQQALIDNVFLNFDKSTFTINNTVYDCIAITQNDSGLTPPPGQVTKNFVLTNLSNNGTVDIIAMSGLTFTPISGIGYNNAPVLLARGESIRGDITETPVNGVISGILDLTIDVAGLSGAVDFTLYTFGEDLQTNTLNLNNGTGQQITCPYNLVYGGTLFAVLIGGNQAAVPPVPPVRTGALVVQTNRPHYIIDAIDQIKLPNTGINYPVSNNVQIGAWNMNSTNSIDVDIINNSVIAGGAVVYCQVNGVTVDQKIAPLGASTLTFNNVPNPIPNGQGVRITFVGV